MSNASDSSPARPSCSESAGTARGFSERQQVITGLQPEIDQWQSRIDAAKLQMHLGSKDAREKLRPHVERLEQDLSRARASWAQLEASSENAWIDTLHGLKISLLALQRSFDKTKQYFENLEES